MNTRISAWCLTAVCLTVLWASVATGQVGMPEVVITPVAHEGDAAPGIPGATFDYFLPPQIDAEGNLLFLADLAGPGIDSSNYVSIYYGPPGALELIAWMGQPAPDMGGAVIMESLVFADQRLSENGWIAFTADLSGPGIVAGLNDMATFAGPPGDIRKVLQGGDQAPGLEPGIMIDVSGVNGLGTFLSDKATFWVVAWLAGPGVDATNDRAFWTGTRDNLQLAFREGMPAPGCEPGVTFAWADNIAFNDSGEVVFRGGLTGEGVDGTNNTGRWAGGPGDLTLVTREADPVPGFPEGVVYTKVALGLWALNNYYDYCGEMGESFEISGPGITEDNNGILSAGLPEDLQLLAREGDPAPEAGPGVQLDAFGNHFINDQRQIFYQVRYRGSSIDDSNKWAMYFGAYDDAQLTLRDANPAPRFGDGTLLSRVAIAPQLAAMNDVGDVVTTIEITGADVTDENKVVLWLRDSILGQWAPLLRSGASIDGRVVWAESAVDIGSNYQNKTGGSDGQPQSLNDARQLAVKIEFTDGTQGVYRIEPPFFGDADADHDVDIDDWAVVQSCITAPEGSPLSAGCELFDFDWDGDVDLDDFGVFQRLFGGVSG